MTPKKVNPINVMYKNTSEPDQNGCINWLGNRDKLGYGRIVVNKKLQLVHRFSYFMYHDKYPENNACHSCDNPSCVNPFHLFDGTQHENIHDKIKKGRALSGDHSGQRNGRAKLTQEIVNKIRKEKIETNITNKALSLKYGVGQSQMTRIINNIHWPVEKVS